MNEYKCNDIYEEAMRTQALMQFIVYMYYLLASIRPHEDKEIMCHKILETA